MKLCKDCKHHIFEKPMEHWCLALYTRDDNRYLITGRYLGAYDKCYDMRYGTEQLCGKEAKLFEPKKKWWKLW